ncbi:pyruvate dehydrogenase (acetyl-transferring) E1 component subunit alpha [Psychrobacillus lasiicapitis]|uniref:Pyruvate dehydrogenase E1 component subunit alpha n=1 Tax=Psychrobacillus lasiicapitis TaxID=1636719 RepID=A0A544SWI0_9BACI|nr:pyruvate dehydrogenase (acetyl-transferring) E1 component subunit alpha [Psychrobacillus lasiicapitis]TQR09553.1 pyruvate dehydrogenase (acetyl-transferring) E1 component subunit alpha [Psychrobacillus lasiicapitis]GGA29507.1 pyruvate dehydrogenase (acetyl-transferring) E1 component subunit alpha [Psychrobacillus lasiicapitis]
MEDNYPIKRIIDDQGSLVDTGFENQIDEQLVQDLYYHMLRIRTFDRKAINLQRQGRLGTYAPFEGQEAAQVGSALALKAGDWVFPTYRDHGATITFGKSMARTFLYWNGRVEGCVAPQDRNIFPPAVPIATQLPHAAGAAWAEKRRGTQNAAIAYFGDGATSEGDFHEGLNFASVFKVPVVFFNQNNGYAISVPIEKQMNSETIAQKSVAYGIPGVRIDGNDCFAVYFETKKAFDNARAGNGPTLIEAVTWRKGAHTTADDPSKYRPEKQGEDFVDPLTRLELFMKNYGHWNDEWIQATKDKTSSEVEAAVDEMEKFPPPNLEDVFNHVYAEMPAQLVEQRESYLAHLGRR